MKEDESNPEEDAVSNEVLQTCSHGLKDTAIWRLLDGPGATPEVAARTPVASRTAAGRLDFVLQVPLLLHHGASSPRGLLMRSAQADITLNGAICM